MTGQRQLQSVVALIPARSGSKRIPGKNLRRLDRHPLIAYTIASALQSGIFADVIVSTDSEACAVVAAHYGASIPFLRPVEYAGDTSPDIEWVEHAVRELADRGVRYDCFSLLRPTSPFRQPETIRRAWEEFVVEPGVDSLRAVELCAQHPGKMWVVRDRRMHPLLPLGPPGAPWHSSQYPALPQVYVQNASLEIAWTRIVEESRTIAGEVVLPFFTTGYEGFDVNRPHDWLVAAELVRAGEARLPVVTVEPYSR
jgi:CMP-N,N'-diacetyllegionaminic acid synthase